MFRRFTPPMFPYLYGFESMGKFDRRSEKAGRVNTPLITAVVQKHKSNPLNRHTLQSVTPFPQT